MLYWNAKKILSVRLHRWDIEPLHEQIKQFLGAEDSQLRTEEGVRKLYEYCAQTLSGQTS